MINMDLGVVDKVVFKTTISDIAKMVQDKEDVTVVAMAKDIGSIIPFLKLNESIIICDSKVKNIYDIVMFTKLNINNSIYLHIDNILNDSNCLIDIDYDCSTVYVDYNVRFVLSDKIYEDIISNGAIGINIE